MKVVPTSSMCALPAPESDLSEVFSEKSSGPSKSENSVFSGPNFQKIEEIKKSSLLIATSTTDPKSLDMG